MIRPVVRDVVKDVVTDVDPPGGGKKVVDRNKQKIKQLKTWQEVK